MKIETYKTPKSSFLAVEKDLSLIISRIMKNERLKKLIYYSEPDALNQPNVPQKEALDMLGSQIKIVPKIYVDKPKFCYLLISCSSFIQNLTNPEFRDNTIIFTILCHFDQWNLGNFKLRPYAIASELDSMFNRERLTGIGKIEFVQANEINENDQLGGFEIIYKTSHAYDGEDSKHPFNPKEEEDIQVNFDEIFNKIKDGL